MEVKRIQNPWVGPSSYQDPAKSNVKVKFCGRENETYDLMHLIDENFLVTLYGKSGNGKTSLLQAGVFPQLRREQYLPVMLRLGMIEEGKSFQSYIKEVIESEIACISGKVETIPVIEEQTDETAADHLWNYFARHHYYNKEGDTLFPVIVFDQFEEVLRTRENIKRTEALLSQLNYLIDESHALGDCLVDGEPYTYDFNFRFVISIREDELYRLEDCIDNIYQPSLKRCRYRLNALSREDAETIILTPGREYINSAEQGEVISRIIDSATNKEDGAISPFMLSLICSELFKKAAAANAETPQITVAMIDQLGQNILRDFYLGIIQDLPDSDRIFLEDNLVDANRMRNSVNVGMMNIGCPAWHNLTEGTNRILQETNGKVELVHDQLALAVFEIYETRKETERLSTLEREKEEMRRKNRRRMMLMGVVAMSVLGIAAVFAYQYIKINEGQIALEKAYFDLTNKNKLLERQKQDLVSANNVIKLKGDSLEFSGQVIKKSRDSLSIIVKQLEISQQKLLTSTRIAKENERKAIANLWTAMENEARAVANNALILIRQGDPLHAIQNILSIMPENLEKPERPYLAELEFVLREANDSLNVGRQITTLSGHKQHANSIVFDDVNNYLFSAGVDQSIFCWNLNKGSIENYSEIESPYFGLPELSVQGNTLVVNATDSYMYSLDHGFLPLDVPKDAQRLIQLSPNKKWMSYGSGRETTTIKNLKTGKTNVIRGGFITRFSRDSKYLVVVPNVGNFATYIYDLGNQSVTDSIPKNNKESFYTRDIIFSPDNSKLLVCISVDNESSVFEEYSFPSLERLWTLESDILDNACYVDNQHFALWGVYGYKIFDSKLNVQDSLIYREDMIYGDYNNNIASIAFSKDGGIMALATKSDKQIKIINWKRSKAKLEQYFGEYFRNRCRGIPHLNKPDFDYNTISQISVNGRIKAKAKKNMISIIDVSTNNEIFKLGNDNKPGTIYFLQFYNNDKNLVSISSDNSIRFWKLTNQTEMVEKRIDGVSGNLVWSNNVDVNVAKDVYVYSSDRDVFVRRYSTNELLYKYTSKSSTNDIGTTFFSEDGNSILFNYSGYMGDFPDEVYVLPYQPLETLCNTYRMRFK